MIIPACFKIPIATLKKESDQEERGLDIGRLRHSRVETDLAALKKENTPRRVTPWRMGFGAGKSPANRTRCSLSPYSAEIASTDTPSDVSVAVSLERHWFATLSATDPRLGSPENVPKAAPLKHGGGGQIISVGAVAESDSALRKFLANGVRAAPRCGVRQASFP